MAKDTSFPAALHTFTGIATAAFEQASAQAREARQENGETLKLLQDLKLTHEEQRGLWKDHLILARDELQAANQALQVAETTTANYAETIAALRQQLGQSETQSKNWQDHFIRSEQERCRLAGKIEHAESMAHSRANGGGAPAQRAPSSSNDNSSRTATTSANQTKQGMKASQTPRLTAPHTSLSRQPLPEPIVIRRVQAVVEFPVKEEYGSEEESMSEEQPVASGSRPPPVKRSRGNATKPRASIAKPTIASEHEKNEEDEAREEGCHTEEYEEEETGDDEIMLTSKPGRKQAEASRPKPKSVVRSMKPAPTPHKARPEPNASPAKPARSKPAPPKSSRKSVSRAVVEEQSEETDNEEDEDVAPGRAAGVQTRVRKFEAQAHQEERAIATNSKKRSAPAGAGTDQPVKRRR